MKTFTPALVRFIKEEDGAQVVEYALIIAVVSIGLVLAFGPSSDLNNQFTLLVKRIGTCLSTGTC
jgi:pilus assembly protein Flp/PilA